MLGLGAGVLWLYRASKSEAQRADERITLPINQEQVFMLLGTHFKERTDQRVRVNTVGDFVFTSNPVPVGEYYFVYYDYYDSSRLLLLFKADGSLCRHASEWPGFEPWHEYFWRQVKAMAGL
jgi:hypothetical protein